MNFLELILRNILSFCVCVNPAPIVCNCGPILGWMVVDSCLGVSRWMFTACPSSNGKVVICNSHGCESCNPSSDYAAQWKIKQVVISSNDILTRLRVGETCQLTVGSSFSLCCLKNIRQQKLYEKTIYIFHNPIKPDWWWIIYFLIIFLLPLKYIKLFCEY